ncbi:MAG TPA: baseplate J/gp47 family protein [Candidatus Enterenecus stercoripullorum]|nr:baseplate J/gp47 family protein [Candidatus Enterenecus stercoripullorum]
MPIFENETPETIKTRILERMSTELQTREGSYTNDMVSPMSFEIWRWCMTMDELITAFYVDENSGKYLDDHATLLGLARKVGTRAYATIHFTGRDGTIVPAGTVFLAPTGLEYSLVYDVTLADGEGEGYLQAGAVGDAYNAEAGEITQILRNISGLTSWNNEAAQGGTDPESDADLFARIDRRRKDPGTSGNEAHYREWALECDGVGACKVTKLWNGPGTVRVLLAGYDRQPVDEDVVQACYDYIEEYRRPIGADVTVVSATGTAINIAAKLVLKNGAALPDVKTMFAVKLDTYLQELASEYFQASATYPYTLYYNRIAALLMAVEGVQDYSTLLVNGGTSNITIGETAVPVMGTVTLE